MPSAIMPDELIGSLIEERAASATLSEQHVHEEFLRREQYRIVSGEEDYTSSSVDVTVLLPAYDEEEAVEKVIDDCRRAMEETEYTYEILLVDDCSTDATLSLAEARGVRCVQRERNGGSGAARKTGILEARGRVIVMLDVDGSYNAADIPKLLSEFPKFDQVNGARTSEEGTARILRVPAKWLIRKLACYLSKERIPDLNTGLKAFKRDLMLTYLWVIPDGFSCVTTMTLAFLCNGHRVKYVPTKYFPRIGKSKFHMVGDTARYFMTVLRMILFFRPMRVFLPLAMLLGTAGVVKSALDRIFVGHMQFSDVALLTAAATLLMIGIMAEFSLGVIKSIKGQIANLRVDLLRELHKRTV
ncbi:MAG: glycosyltransferase family 2 protein [Planctomycetota bacterium]